MLGRIVMSILATAAAVALLAGLITAALIGWPSGIATGIVAFVTLSLVCGVGLILGPPPSQLPLPRQPKLRPAR